MIPTNEAIEKICSYRWEIRVTRAGYIQSKQIVRDGDRIEVDADKGIVKLLRRKP